MSTRAMIEVADSTDKVYRLYVHGDGYPGFLGVLVLQMMKVAPELDWNVTHRRHGEIPEELNGIAWLSAPNTALEAGKFAAFAVVFHYLFGHTSIYLDDFDPREHEHWLDYVYRVCLDGGGEMHLEWWDMCEGTPWGKPLTKKDLLHEIDMTEKDICAPIKDKKYRSVI